MMLIGAHVHTADGLDASIDYAHSVGAEAIQFFAKSPRRWTQSERDPVEARRFVRRCREEAIPVFTHGSYLINPGSEDPQVWQRSVMALADELLRGAQVGASGVVTHLGRRFSDDDERSIARLVETVGKAYDFAGDDAARILLENSAGAGRQFGVTAEEMAGALNAVRDAGLPAALCIDTCHCMAAGIDVSVPEGWTVLLDRLDELAGPGSVALVHANDCKGALGERVDRHAWIGEGSIGDTGFAAMFAQGRLTGVPAIIEMPGDVPVKDEENVSRLRRLRDVGEGHGGQDRAPV